MGESVEDRAGMLVALHIKPQPNPLINALVPVEGTPMEEAKPVEIWEMIRMVATAKNYNAEVRLSAGRMNMSREGQAMCFFAGPIQFLQVTNYYFRCE
jgi:biotin synthase